MLPTTENIFTTFLFEILKCFNKTDNMLIKIFYKESHNVTFTIKYTKLLAV